MTAPRDLDRQLRDHFDTHADRAVLDGQLDAIVGRTARLGQRPGWLAGLRSQMMSATTVVERPAMPRATFVLVVVGLLIVHRPRGGDHRWWPVDEARAIQRDDRLQPPRRSPGDQVIAYVINPDGTHERALRPEGPRGGLLVPGRDDRSGSWTGTSTPTAAGFASSPFANGTLNVPCWDWSPDGASCLAEGWDDTDPSRSGLYLVSALDHSNPRQITHRRDLPGAFSPDGSLIAFRPLVGDLKPSALMVVGVDGRGERVVGNLLISNEISWAPDGRSILVQSGLRLHRVQLDSGEATPIRIEDAPEAAVYGGAFSPDGTRIVFRRPDTSNLVDIFTMRADGTDVVRLTTSPDDEWGAEWGTHPLDK